MLMRRAVILAALCAALVSASLPATVRAAKAPLIPTMTLIASDISPVYGEPVTFSAAVVSPKPGTPVPTGTVNFGDVWANYGTVTLEGGIARLTVPGLDPMPHNVGAVYSGDSRYPGVAAGVTITVRQAPTAVRLSSLTNPSTPGQPVAFEADTFTPPGDAYAVGDVEFFDNGTTLLGVSQLDGMGTAVLIAPLVAGTHSITAQYEGGGVFGGSTSDPLIQTVAALTPSQRFVDQLFNDILGRPNTDTSWASAIDRHQVSRTQVAAALSTSTENVTNEVQAMYWAHLGRAADPAGLAYWVGYIQQGRGTAEELEESFLGTPEYFADSGGTADTFMRAIFQDVLGRQPDAGGRAYWDARIASGTPTWVVAASVVMSTEAMRTRVTNDFWQILWRAPDAGGLAYWSRALQGGVHDELLIAGLAGSVEYWQKTQH